MDGPEPPKTGAKGDPASPPGVICAAPRGRVARRTSPTRRAAQRAPNRDLPLKASGPGRGRRVLLRVTMEGRKTHGRKTHVSTVGGLWP